MARAPHAVFLCCYPCFSPSMHMDLYGYQGWPTDSVLSQFPACHVLLLLLLLTFPRQGHGRQVWIYIDTRVGPPTLSVYKTRHAMC
jgi:hypothetical protein